VQRGIQRRRSRLRANLHFWLLVLVMLVTHFAEMALWTGTLMFLGAIPALREAFYYAASTYTTIGYGEGTLPKDWRLMAPMMAISGLFAFGWTTSVLVTVFAQIFAEWNTGKRSRKED
jgi:hypothetical protein